MQVLVKAAPKTNNFLAKTKNKTNLIEVQLTSWFTTDEMLKESMRPDIDIINVHTPLLESKDEQLTDAINVDEVLLPFTYKVLLDTCLYAEQLSKYYNHDIKIIVHNGWSQSDWEKSQLIERIAEVFKTLIERFPHIIFAIENVTPITRFGFRSGCFPEDAAFLALELNQRTKTNKFSTVIDICHLLMTNYTFETIAPNSEVLRPLSIQEAFKQTKGLCSVIHLNNKIGNGMEKNHGTSFTDSETDKKILKEILEACQTYTPNADIVIEVREDDYLNCINYLQTIKMLQEVNETLESPETLIFAK